MATLNLDILEAAHSDGLLPKRLSRNQALYLHATVLSANEIYWIVAEEEGITILQLENKTGLHKNTVKQFVRWFLSKELIYSEEIENRKYILFTAKRHKVMRAKQ